MAGMKSGKARAAYGAGSGGFRYLAGIKSDRGTAAFDIVIYTALIIFVILPVFAAVFEKYLIACKAQVVKDAVDLSNISVYNAINTGSLSKTALTFDNSEVADIYRQILSKNLNLNGDLTPKGNSVAEAAVTVDSLVGYTGGFPVECPNGKTITRPAIHSLVTVPVRPGLYRQMVLSLTGRRYIEMKVHVDTDIPLDK